MILLSIDDITERSRSEQARAHLSAIVESSTDAVISADLDGVISSWNRGAERLYGWSAGEAIGQAITLIVPPPGQSSEVEHLFERICKGERIEHYETVFRRKDGTLREISASISPITDARGEIIGVSNIARDVTEEKRVADALRQSREDLSEANRRKDEFLAMLAHELRNPLAPMRLAAETMRAIGSADPTIAFGAAVMDRQTMHLSRLVDDLLDVARISRGEIGVQKMPIELTEVVERALEIGKPFMEEREHRLTVASGAKPIYLEGDSVRLAQVVANLLSNAAKFTPKGGIITVSMHVEDDEAVIKVRDNGIGISAEMLPSVFDMFYQADASLGRTHGGMGIGLALARRLVELHAGSIEAKSDGQGKGSEFIVRLPRLKGAPALPHAAKRIEIEHATTARYRILIVDDNVDAAKSMQMFLHVQGHEARCVFDGFAAVQVAQEFKPQLVLLDIAMPGMDGYEVVRQLRKQASPVRPVVVAVTGYTERGELERMKQAGLDRHLAKPVAPEALLTLISSLG